MTYLNQRVPDINLSNLEDFLEAVEASTDEEKEEPDEPNIAEGASGAMFDSLPKVQAETPKKGRSRHVVDNLLILNFLINIIKFLSCSPDPTATSETTNLNSQNIFKKYYLKFLVSKNKLL